MVADNGSTDTTIELAESWRKTLPDLTIVREARRGRQHACNAGARVGRGEFLVFVDGDDQVMPGFLEAMCQGLENYDVVGGRLDHHLLRLGGSDGVGEVQVDRLMDGSGYLPFVSGSAMGIRRAVFEAVGGFSPDKDYCEDVDLCWKAQIAGYSIGFAEDAVIAYRQRETLGGMYRQHRNYGVARALLFRDYARRGMPRRSWDEVARSWLGLMRSAPFLRDRAARARWIRKLGRNVGFLQGSVRFRVLFP